MSDFSLMSSSVPLSEICSYTNGGTPSKKIKEYWGGNIPWITSTEIQDGDVADARVTISIEGERNSAASRVDEGTVLLVTRTGVGKVARAPVPLSFSQDITAIIPKNGLVDRQYLFRFLQTQRHYFERFSRGATIKGVTRDTLNRLEIPLPNLEEQKRIAAILDKADAIRRKRQDAIRSVRDFVPALFAEMFGDPVRNPHQWSYVSLNHFVDAFEGGKNIATDDTPSDATKYFILKVSAVTWDEFNPNEAKPVPRDFTPPKSFFVKQGDLLFSRANTTQLVGACVFVFETPDNLLLPDKLWRVKLSEPRKANLLYLRYAFGHPAIQAQIGKRATGTSGSMKNISKAKMMSLEVPLPPVDLQDEFASIILQHRQLVTNCTTSLNASDDLFNSLVQRAFKGEL